MSVETDRELLKFAAKAAGYTTEHKWNAERLQLDPPVIALVVHENGELVSTGWNPLDTDGHALRLAVKLRLVVHVWNDGETVSVAKTLPDGEDPPSNSNAWYSATTHAHNDDLFAATRRAIVHAAAQIGRAMP